jgi:hypothetical protein
MKITLLHPSRGRAKKARSTFDYWISKSSGRVEIEHMVAIDEDDNQKYDYYKAFDNSKISIIICGQTSDVVSATNSIARFATGDVFVYLSDDFKCPDNWDEKIVQRFHIMDGQPITEPLLLKVDDDLQPFHVAVLTIPIMNKELYKKLGYFWHPGYKSMFVDEDLYWTCRENKWMLLCSDLKFPHEHAANGKVQNDDTYKRSAANWDTGKEFFKERKALNFPL